LRLLSYNIKHGGSGREAHLTAVMRLARPDLVVLQEAIDPKVVDRLAAALELPHHAAAPGRSLAFMSRVPIAHFEWHRPRLSRHAFLEIVPAEGDVRIFGLHLSAVHAAWTERRRMFELRALLASIARHQHGFHVLTGDFNTLAPGEVLEGHLLPPRLRVMVWMSGGRIQWRTIQHVLDSGYVDTYRRCHPDESGLTFPTWGPHIRLDFAFVPAQFVDRLRSSEVITSEETKAASDHLPLLTEIVTGAKIDT
jgi:endonuclease/exonuclease/phosphatase family metal-dependent hydrolase